ncbi:MAG: 1-acyl-sn-glycerol-3-phosphate acyltransferase [Myxococcales bacterium]|nr:1-acyl-sn-glycerol-3-phosphate acyltransferase [Myxococcales bacterium]
MELSIETLAALPTPLVRSALAGWVGDHLDCPTDAKHTLRLRLQEIIDAASDADIERMRGTFRTAGDDWRLYPADPLAQQLTRTYMAAVATPWIIHGEGNLRSFLGSPAQRRMIVCNHLSYTDTQVTDVVLWQAGLAEFAGRLVAVAGPKVYTEAWRRMASIALNTRKTAQSSVVASEQDTLTPRELANVALQTLAHCAELMDSGMIVLLYPEGTRARDGRLQPFLRAAARYLNIEGVQVLPLGQEGGETMYPVDAPLMYRAEARLSFGEAFTPREYPGKIGALTEAHVRLSALLSEPFRPHVDAARVA